MDSEVARIRGYAAFLEESLVKNLNKRLYNYILIIFFLEEGGAGGIMPQGLRTPARTSFLICKGTKLANIFDLFKKLEAGRGEGAPAPGHVEFIVCGLGNPGPEYAFTRHNAGFMALDYIADREKISVVRAKFDALTADAMFAGKRVLFMKPQTYMNRSGAAVRAASDFYKITPDRILVISDDINLAPGKMRVRRSGSDGGQKGLRDIIEKLGTDAFARVRLGVGSPPPGGDIINWVLGKIPEEDRAGFNTCVEHASDAAALIINGKIDEAMCKYN
jgi:peptidyl-tRNA hydrolase